MIDHSQKYKDSDVEVVRKDGIILLREMAAEVKNFMDFKMNAVMVSSRDITCDYVAANVPSSLPPYRHYPFPLEIASNSLISAAPNVFTLFYIRSSVQW